MVEIELEEEFFLAQSEEADFGASRVNPAWWEDNEPPEYGPEDLEDPAYDEQANNRRYAELLRQLTEIGEGLEYEATLAGEVLNTLSPETDRYH